jgi:hypothetical protein
MSIPAQIAALFTEFAFSDTIANLKSILTQLNSAIGGGTILGTTTGASAGNKVVVVGRQITSGLTLKAAFNLSDGSDAIAGSAFSAGAALDASEKITVGANYTQADIYLLQF